MSDEPNIEVKWPCYVKIATLQCRTQSEVLSAQHARRLFEQLKEKGYGMRLELWTKTHSIDKQLDQHPINQ